MTSIYGDAYGISAAEGNDTISNLGTLSVTGNSPIGISTGLGMDMVLNTGNLFATGADSTNGSSTGILVEGGLNNIIRNTGALEATTNVETSTDESEVNSEAIGISLSGEEHIVSNSGSVTVKAIAFSDPGNFLPFDEAEGHAKGKAAGILNYIGSSTITNSGTLKVDSMLTADANAESFSNAEATATIDTSWLSGIETGSEDDVITNSGDISLLFKSNAEADAVGIGTPIFFLFAKAAATATIESSNVYGIDVDEGNNEITNEGKLNITIDAVVETDAAVLALTALNSDATAKIEDLVVVGINAGDDKNMITNIGSITLAADHLEALATASGTTDGDAVASVTASFYGIKSGTGQNHIMNDASGVISVQTSVRANADSFAPISGSSTATTNVSAYGIYDRGSVNGGGPNVIINQGTINAYAEASSKGAHSGSSSFSSKASAYGIYVDGSVDDGSNVIINQGTITAVGKGIEAIVVGIQGGRASILFKTLEY